MIDNRGDKIIRSSMEDIQISFDKEAAWKRLQPRIDSRSATGPVFFIKWSLAAALLIATLIWITTPKTENPTITLNKPVAIEAKAISNKAASVETISLKSSENTRILNKTTKRTSVSKQDAHTSPALLENRPVAKMDTVMAITVKEPVPTPVLMKIVHINELAEQERIEHTIRQMRYVEHKQKTRIREELPDGAELPTYHNQFKIDFTP